MTHGLKYHNSHPYCQNQCCTPHGVHELKFAQDDGNATQPLRGTPYGVQRSKRLIDVGLKLISSYFCM